ncbi:hypothetical protein Cni_G23453 [Canna indica]|uniref:RNase H type-1 domain-containing protein n=1 Tax=Canna indica TaxID=4628 RepID=A0AAQ3L0F6_9LILI|nr:hypothetical protein Cni_G23453 [Canna indica]
MARLDKAYANYERVAKHNRAQVTHLKRIASDQCPLLIDTKEHIQNMRKARNFVFELYWIEYNEISEKVGLLENNLRETMENLERLENKDAEGVMNENELDELRSLTNKAMTLNRQIQIKWWSKARTKMVTGDEDIVKEFERWYIELWENEWSKYHGWNQLNKLHWKRISREHHSKLTEAFTDGEIFRAMNSLGKGQGKHEFHLVKWDKVTLRKADGGLGVKDPSIVKAQKQNCYVCKEDEDSAEHIFYEYGLAKLLWSKLEEVYNRKFEHWNEWKEGRWIEEGSKLGREESAAWMGMIAAGHWALWRNRNGNCFRDKCYDLNTMICSILADCCHLVGNRVGNTSGSRCNLNTGCSDYHWQWQEDVRSQNEHEFNMFSDATWLEGTKEACLGVYVEDKLGRKMFEAHCYKTLGSPMVAEAWAIWYGLNKLRNMNIKHLKIFSNCTNVVKMLNRKRKVSWFMKELIAYIIQVGREMEVLDWNYVRRAEKGKAHFLAKARLQEKEERIEMGMNDGRLADMVSCEEHVLLRNGEGSKSNDTSNQMAEDNSGGKEAVKNSDTGWEADSLLNKKDTLNNCNMQTKASRGNTDIRAKMGGGMEVNKNRFIEDWSSARENLELNFRWTRRNLAIVGLFGIAVPILVYKGIVREFHMQDEDAGRPYRKFL